MIVKRFVSRLIPFVVAGAIALAGQAGGAGAAPPASGAAVPAGVAPSADVAAIITWNNIALHSAVVVAKQFQPQSYVYISFAQAAVYDAVDAIEGGYQPYHYRLPKREPNASVEAAVATAAHDVLVHYFPAQQAALDADWVTSLAGVVNTPNKADGIAIGRAAAASLIAFRQGDGLEANIGFTMPAPAPGVWQLPAGQTPQTPWLSKLRPFLLNSPDQFRPGPPPALNSPEYAASYNESKYFGAANSIYRTPAETDIALFWTSNAPTQYNTAFQNLALTRHLNPIQTARLFAMGDLVGADALIACWDAKYTYLAWRPAFAIPQGDTDGNPLTIGDPTWKPVGATPNHPEYPSAHGCATEATAYVLMDFLGTSNINLDVTGTAPNLVQTTRHYATAADLVDEVVNARVWIGFHFRFSGLAGVHLGQRVAAWTLQRYFQPIDD